MSVELIPGELYVVNIGEHGIKMKLSGVTKGTRTVKLQDGDVLIFLDYHISPRFTGEKVYRFFCRYGSVVRERASHSGAFIQVLK